MDVDSKVAERWIDGYIAMGNTLDRDTLRRTQFRRSATSGSTFPKNNQEADHMEDLRVGGLLWTYWAATQMWQQRMWH